MDRDLEELLSAIIGSDPHSELDDKKRESLVFTMLGMVSTEKLEALCRFCDSISSIDIRSSLLNKVATKVPAIDSRRARKIADSIPLPYWRLSAMIDIASQLLQFDRRAGKTRSTFSEDAFNIIREVEISIPHIPEEDGDRATIVWQAGHVLVENGELDWAEKLAACDDYCPDRIDVLLRIARLRASETENTRALQIARHVADLACRSTDERQAISRAYDLGSVAEILYGLGERAAARQYLDTALQLAVPNQHNDTDGVKCVAGLAISLAQQGDFDAAHKVANEITIAGRRDYALEKINELMAKAAPTQTAPQKQ
jgi:tetratricopeptide (TPR) repeat protein